MKKAISLSLVLMFFLSLTCPAYAAVQDEIIPLYDEITSVYAYITIDDTLGIATCTGRITAKDTMPVKLIVTLQVYKDNYWQTVKTWTGSGTYYVSNTSRYAIDTDYSYRVYVIGYVNNSGGVILESATAIDYP